MAKLIRKRREGHTKATGKAFMVVFDHEDRFVPSPHAADYKTKYPAVMLHAIFLVKSQADEYVKERVEAGFWKDDIRLAVVEVEINEL